MDALNSGLHIITHNLNIWDGKFIMPSFKSVTFLLTAQFYKFHLKCMGRNKLVYPILKSTINTPRLKQAYSKVTNIIGILRL